MASGTAVVENPQNIFRGRNLQDKSLKFDKRANIFKFQAPKFEIPEPPKTKMIRLVPAGRSLADLFCQNPLALRANMEDPAMLKILRKCPVGTA